MRNILVLNSAVTPASVSRRLVQAVVDRLAGPGADVVVRDLASQPAPHLAPATLAGVMGEPLTEAEIATRVLSDELIAELRRADVIVIGAPMYNFSIPTSLRAWFDHVIRAGETFSYAGGGPEGLLKGKRAIVVSTRGGRYGEGPDNGDFQEPYLRRLLAFIGVSDVCVIRAEGLAFGEAEQAAALRAAEAEIEALTRAAAA